MNKTWLQLFISCLLFQSVYAFAADIDMKTSSVSLLPKTVLQQSARFVPQILAASANRDANVGKLQQADGAFDTRITSEVYSRASGFWNGQRSSTKISKPLGNYSAEIYGAYNLSRGNFPIYEDINFTNLGGELRLGVAFSLLRNREFDQRRFKRQDAKLALKVTDYELQSVYLDIQRNALQSYNKWLASGLKKKTFENLLNLALKREDALRIRINEGDAPEILLTENRQNIILRQALLAEAERELQNSAITLSFYYRDDAGEPFLPGTELLPDDNLFFKLDEDLPNISTALYQALNNRPEPSRLNIEMERAQQRIRLAQNDYQPSLDLRYEVATDVGGTGQGGVSREGVDNIVSLNFSLPLQRNQAVGKRIQAESELSSLNHKQKAIEDSIEIELRKIYETLHTAEKLKLLAEQEIDQAVTMRKAEQKLFQSGASNFFLVNQREVAVANALNRRIITTLQYRQGLAELAVISADFQTLKVPLTNE